MYLWANTVDHARIGTTRVDGEYPLWGPDLSNNVEAIGVHGNAGAFEAAKNCRDYRRAVAKKPYDYIVTGPDGILEGDPPEATWLRGPSVTEVLHIESAIVFKRIGPIDPNGCPPSS